MGEHNPWSARYVHVLLLLLCLLFRFFFTNTFLSSSLKYIENTQARRIMEAFSFSTYSLPERLPIQASESYLSNEDLPLQHKLLGTNLLGYPQRPMVASVDDIESLVKHLLVVNGCEPARSVGWVHRATVIKRQRSAR